MSKQKYVRLKTRILQYGKKSLSNYNCGESDAVSLIFKKDLRDLRITCKTTTQEGTPTISKLQIEGRDFLDKENNPVFVCSEDDQNELGSILVKIERICKEICAIKHPEKKLFNLF